MTWKLCESCRQQRQDPWNLPANRDSLRNDMTSRCQARPPYRTNTACCLSLPPSFNRLISASTPPAYSLRFPGGSSVRLGRLVAGQLLSLSCIHGFDLQLIRARADRQSAGLCASRPSVEPRFLHALFLLIRESDIDSRKRCRGDPDASLA